MRWILSGALMAGLLLILWGAIDARQDQMQSNATSPVLTSSEGGTGLPPPNPPPPPPGPKDPQ